MSTAGFGYVNHVDNDTTGVSAGDASSNLPAANVQDPRLQKVWRSGTSIATNIAFDFASSVPVDVIALFGALLGPNDTIRVRLSNIDAASGELLDTGVGVTTGIVAGYDQFLYLCGSTINARYLRFDINSISHFSDGYFDIGRVWAGPLWTPGIYFQPGDSGNWVDPSVVTRSPRSGSTFKDQGTKYRTKTVTFDALSEADKATAEAMDLYVGVTGQILFVIDKDTPADFPTVPILGKQRTVELITQPNQTDPARYSKTYTVDEDR